MLLPWDIINSNIFYLNNDYCKKYLKYWLQKILNLIGVTLLNWGVEYIIDGFGIKSKRQTGTSFFHYLIKKREFAEASARLYRLKANFLLGSFSVFLSVVLKRIHLRTEWVVKCWNKYYISVFWRGLTTVL